MEKKEYEEKLSAAKPAETQNGVLREKLDGETTEMGARCCGR